MSKTLLLGVVTLGALVHEPRGRVDRPELFTDGPNPKLALLPARIETAPDEPGPGPAITR